MSQLPSGRGAGVGCTSIPPLHHWRRRPCCTREAGDSVAAAASGGGGVSLAGASLAECPQRAADFVHGKAVGQPRCGACHFLRLYVVKAGPQNLDGRMPAACGMQRHRAAPKSECVHVEGRCSITVHHR